MHRITRAASVHKSHSPPSCCWLEKRPVYPGSLSCLRQGVSHRGVTVWATNGWGYMLHGLKVQQLRYAVSVFDPRSPVSVELLMLQQLHGQQD
jgi:hypothetical protein